MEQNNKQETPAPEARYAKPEIDDAVIQWDTDEAPTEWVPTQFEKKIKAIPEDKWKLYQTVGGGLLGLIEAILLFAGNKGMSAGFLIAVVLALLLPNWLENKGRRKLYRARIAMIAVLGISIVVMLLYNGFTYGWDFFKKKDEAEAAVKLLRGFVRI